LRIVVARESLAAVGAQVSMEEEIAEVVREHGWFAASIGDYDPPFLYSIGLMQTYGHPEFIMFGLEADNAHALFTQLIADLRGGRRYDESGVQTIQLGGDDHRVGFRPVHPTQHELYLGFAMGYCRHIGRWGELEAVQVYWPDAAGKFPFDAGCDLDVYRLQPRLDLPLTPQELRKLRRELE
jgi:hypothetical protein